MSEPGTAGALDRAATLCDLGRYAEASDQLRVLLAVEPGNRRALCLLAVAGLGLDRYEESLQASRAAIAADPDDEWAYRLAALALLALDNPADAVTMARTAIHVAPLVSYGYSVLARALVGVNGDLTEARLAADRALSLAPHDVDSFLAVSEVACAQGRWDEAEQAVHQALALDPNNSNAHNELGRIQLRRRKYLMNPGGLARAAGGFATAVRTNPRSTVARNNLDLVLYAYLARTAYGIGLIAVVSNQFIRSDTGGARVIPPLLLLVPLWFSVRFVRGLTRELRRYLLDVLRRPLILAAIGCDVVAAAAIIVGVTVPGTTAAAVGAALLFSIAARILLWLQMRRRLRASARSDPRQRQAGRRRGNRASARTRSGRR